MKPMDTSPQIMQRRGLYYYSFDRHIRNFDTYGCSVLVKMLRERTAGASTASLRITAVCDNGVAKHMPPTLVVMRVRHRRPYE